MKGKPDSWIGKIVCRRGFDQSKFRWIVMPVEENEKGQKRNVRLRPVGPDGENLKGWRPDYVQDMSTVRHIFFVPGEEDDTSETERDDA